jgi:mono/diheme cytochrome c family protein
MASQPSYRPLEASSFFSDGQASRPLIKGTVARGHLELDWHLYTGRIPGTNDKAEAARTDRPLPVGQNAGANKTDFDRGRFVDTFPEPVTRETLDHGYNRYTIYCAVCHDPAGTGRGKIVERGYIRPPSYHIPRLQKAPVGYFYDVITNGFGIMPDYASQIPPRDRWNIVAYIRALQLSQDATMADVPTGQAVPSGPPRFRGQPGSGATLPVIETETAPQGEEKK